MNVARSTETVAGPREYRKRPVVIKAMQWDGTYKGMIAIQAAFLQMENLDAEWHEANNTVRSWRIRTLEGALHISCGDYIIRGVKGEFYPCKPDIFEASYEPA